MVRRLRWFVMLVCVLSIVWRGFLILTGYTRKSVILVCLVRRVRAPRHVVPKLGAVAAPLLLARSRVARLRPRAAHAW